MGTYRGRRVFRSGPVATAISVFVAMLFATGAAMTYRERGWTWVSIALACMTVLGVAGIVETVLYRVQLTDEALLVTDLRGRRAYPVTNIAGVEEAKGLPTTLILSDGRWVKLPSVGSSLGNSIRAWLRHSAR